MVNSSKQVPANTEEILDRSVHREEPLRVRDRFEAAHLSLPLAGRLVRHLRSIVLVLASAMHHGRHHSPVRR